MKKIFTQFGQWILKYKKRLIYGVLAFIFGQICFFNIGGIGVENGVYANDSGNPTSQSASSQEEATKWYEKLSFLQKSVYVLIYPLLAVAGKLADNSFVYGEIFGFDTILRQLWNIMRNLANFGLGFIFVYKIFEFLIKGQKSGDIKKLLISSLIAGIGIQASWFIMAAMIDISTILAYGIGGLPITILKENINGTEDEHLKYNPYILKNIVYVDINDLDTYHMYLTNTDIGDTQAGLYYISECQTFSYKNGLSSEELILAPKMIYYMDKKQGDGSEIIKPTDNNRCHFYGQVYYLNEDSLVEKGTCNSESDCRDKQIKYQGEMDSEISRIVGLNSGDVVGYIKDAKILQVGDAHTPGGVIGTLGPVVYSDDQPWGLDLYNKRTGGDGTTSRLQDIMEGRSYIGIFTALYSSLLNSGRGVIPPDTGTFSALLRVALSLGHVLAIGIPLIAVTIVFMMRIGILWMAIVLLPFIILLKAFNLEDKVLKDDNSILKYLKISNLISIIFAPAIICFAISISTVLVVIISGLNLESISTVKEEILGGLIKMNIGKLSINIGKLIISALGIAITRFLVWAAVEATKLGKSNIIQGLKNLAQTSLGSIPIVPIPGKEGKGVDFIGANTAFGSKGQTGIITRMTQNIKREFDNKDNKALEELLDPESASKKAEGKRKEVDLEEYYKNYKNHLFNDPEATNADWTQHEFDGGNGTTLKFSQLDLSQKKQIINDINALEENNRIKFGSVTEDITIGEGDSKITYNFDQNTKKYEKV